MAAQSTLNRDDDGGTGGAGGRRRALPNPGKRQAPPPDESHAEAVTHHRGAFNTRMAELFQRQRSNQTMLTEDEYNEALRGIRAFDKLKGQERQKAWGSARKFDAIEIGGEWRLCARKDHEKSQEGARLVSHLGCVFDNIREAHIEGQHRKSKALHHAVSTKYANVSRKACELFCATCPTCVAQKTRNKKAKAGSEPILSRGKLGAR